MIAPLQVEVGKPVTFDGYAEDYGKPIVSVEFSLDNGEHWTRYDTPNTNDYQNVTWIPPTICGCTGRSRTRPSGPGSTGCSCAR